MNLVTVGLSTLTPVKQILTLKTLATGSLKNTRKPKISAMSCLCPMVLLESVMILLIQSHTMKLVFMTCAPHYPMMMCCVIVWQNMLRLVGKQAVVLGTGGLRLHNVVSILSYTLKLSQDSVPGLNISLI